MHTTSGTQTREHQITLRYIVKENKRMSTRCLSKVTITAWRVSVMVLRLMLGKPGKRLSKQIWILNKIGRRKREARTLDLAVVVGAKSGPKASQMGPTMENRNKCKSQNEWKVDTDLYRFGKLLLAMFDTSTEPKWEKNWSKSCITWFVMLLLVREFDYSTKTLAKRQ